MHLFSSSLIATVIRSYLWLATVPSIDATLSPIHHEVVKVSADPDKTPVQAATSSTKPLKITNMCTEIIYPAFLTQAGKGPSVGGFRLDPGRDRTLPVSADWQGRVWGRTNCSFNSAGNGPANRGGLNGGGKACVTGDCNGMVECSVSGETPVTLAEFLLRSSSAQSFYDISLVDGYNLPVAIVLIPSGRLKDVPPNLTNPVCIGTAALLAAQGYSPYTSTASVLGTNASYPLVLDSLQTVAMVSKWCPWELQLLPPSRPANGIYAYPDTNIDRPGFEPCFSACAKTGLPSDCCTGSYNSPGACKPSTYSKAAKRVCPDAYSFAYDDQTSTFVIPSGGGFEVVFCPPGRSTNILTTAKASLVKLGQQTGEQVVAFDTRDAVVSVDEHRKDINADEGGKPDEDDTKRDESSEDRRGGGAKLPGGWLGWIAGGGVAGWMVWG